ncbi:MAG TPA: DUF2520 domain-containing protein [Candidatus Kapabacteria bacterium]|nr:DUF2520 domain-containing protein [Candidatus Kapabacteria bacterium]
MLEQGSVGVIGSGQVGALLAIRLHQQNLLKYIINRNSNRLQRLLDNGIDSTIILDNISSITDKVDFIIIATQENQIQNVVIDLLRLTIPLDNTIIFHTSGSLTKEVLKDLSVAKAGIAAAHPFQTFYKFDISTLKKIAWGIDSSASDFLLISQLIQAIDGVPIKLSKKAIEQKDLYHISAIIASNFLMGLLTNTKELLGDIDLKPEVFLAPIVHQTVHNFFENENNQNIPITGPIARADNITIRRHITALEKLPEFQKFYSEYSLLLLNTLKSKELINSDSYLELLKSLNISNSSL